MARNVEGLRIAVSIGGDEVAHFLEWVDFAGNGVPPVAPFTDPVTDLTFPTGTRLALICVWPSSHSFPL